MSAVISSPDAPSFDKRAAVDYDPFAEGTVARVVPTTEPQREIWLADQLGRDASLAFNESVSMRFKGLLDQGALRAALQSLLDRHSALRANLGPDGDTLCVLEQVTLELQTQDLAQLASDERERVVQQRLRAAVETPFALQHDRLFRAELLRLASDEHLLVLTAHHIVCDGWSWWVLTRELAALYAQAVGAPHPSLPPADDFAEYALAEASRAKNATLAADEAYWLTRLAGEAPVLDLPTDRARPARRSFASLRQDHVLPADLVAALRKLGARRGASLFATLLAGFAVLLSRLTGQERIAIGIPAAGQSVDGHDHLVGHCVNTLPLLFDLDLAQPLSHAIDDAQATLLDAIEHQRYTFGAMLRKLDVARDPSRLPLISVLFNIDQALDHEHAAFPGLEMNFASNARSYENFELFINAVQEHGKLRLECQYNRDLFDAATIHRWMGGFEALLRDAVGREDAALANLSIVDAGMRAELDALQPASTAFERECRMHEHFERQCDLTPERIAVRHGATAWTYAELEARANRIAWLLRAQGAHRGVLVGLALDRGPDMLAGLLGILKSGAGYVPLDPGFPADRLGYMVSDAGLAAMLTSRRHAAQFDLRGRPVLALDAMDAELAALPHTRIGHDANAAEPESIAYVIYTSGSTGRPKGVQVPHRAVANFIESMQREPGLTADDMLVAVTTLSFDIAVLELLLPLSVGASVVLADRDTAMDGGALAALLRDSGATVMQATPASWRMLLDADWHGHERFKALCGGEPMPPDLAARLLPRCGSLWNLYGPTETTIWSTCARVDWTPAGRMPDIHIGRPIANTTVWILGANGELCPRGVPGEICIGGEGVTLGYLDRPELNAERFIADRFSASADARLYRTGDRGRWRADGNLEHLGRLDFQVKVRGYRIELGEIESNLAVHPSVASTVVLAREDRPGDVRLVAYVVPAAHRAIDEVELIAHLRGALPDYMLPQHVVVIDAMPLLPNGKVDRRALPAPDPAARAGSEHTPPRNALERAVADAMARVLGVPEIGIHDNFFALGGHSLLAAQLTSRLNLDLDAGLSLRALFDAPTVARLAEQIGKAAGTAPSRPKVVRRADQRRAPLSLMQERLLLLEEFNPGQTTYNTPSGHRLIGPLDVVRLDRALRDLAQRQTVLRTSIVREGGEPVQIVHDDIVTGLLPVDDLSAMPAEQREQHLAKRLREMVDVPFEDFSQAPLFRAALFKLAPDEHALFFMPHHIIWDGWSFDLLYLELSEIYAALGEGRAPDLPELPVTYGDFSTWHREWVGGEQYAAQVAFWRERLGRKGRNGLAPQALPTDKPRQRGMSGRSKSREMAMPHDLVSALHEASQRMDATLFVTLLTAYFAVVGRMADRQDLVVGTPVRGRNTAEVEGLMGYFTNLLPLRVEIDPAKSFAETVREVRAVVLDSFAHPDIRLEDLTRELSLKSEGGGTMLYQALFSFQDARQRVVRWGDLRHERIEVFQPGATEDLGLWFVENSGGLTGGLIYNAEILHDETAVLLGDRYLAMLQAVARDPMQSIETLTRFDDGEPVMIGQIQAKPLASEAAAEIAAEAAIESAAAATHADPRVTYLVKLWSRLLEMPVEPGDNFFDLGGNSMLAVQMADRIFRDTGVRIKLMRFAVQNLQEVAEELPATIGGGGDDSGVGVRLVGGMKRLFGLKRA
jgi:amino acid adenylation domain-containing protein